jgi:hypothetical protein
MRAAGFGEGHPRKNFSSDLVTDADDAAEAAIKQQSPSLSSPFWEDPLKRIAALDKLPTLVTSSSSVDGTAFAWGCRFSVLPLSSNAV